MKFDEDHCSVSNLILCVAVVDDCEGVLLERSEPNGLLPVLIAAVLHALKLGQHSPTGTGAGVPSGQILRSMVQKT